MTQLLNTQNDDWLDTAAAAVRSRQVVALAFERLFGLAADALSPEAVAKVAAVKGRATCESGDRPIAVILPNRQALFHFATALSPFAARLADRYWPGPLTLIVRAKPGIPSPLVSKSGLIGLRVAGPSPAALLAEKTGLPLTATSANLAGEKDAESHRDVMGLDGVDLIIEGSVAGPPGSTVVDASGDTPRILRQGIIHIETGLT